MDFPIPANEPSRLSAVNDFSEPDISDGQEYFDIARIAAQICSTPYASVSFVGEWVESFRSTLDFASEDIERRESMSAYALASPESVTEFTDLAKDPRFSTNPLVAKLKLGFYAGAPLVTREGDAIGTLSVMDTEPRRLTDEQATALLAAARQFTIRLELRRTTNLLRKANEELRSLSLRDELTGLYNYRGFVTHARQHLKIYRTRRSTGSMWMMFADMDGLKDINDRFGHTEGSRAIQITADLIVRTIREADIVARLGGDEFTALLLNTVDAVAQMIPQRLEETISRFNATNGEPFKIALSVGLVKVDQDNDMTVEELIKQADDDMYREKTKRKQLAA